MKLVIEIPLSKIEMVIKRINTQGIGMISIGWAWADIRLRDRKIVIYLFHITKTAVETLSPFRLRILARIFWNDSDVRIYLTHEPMNPCEPANRS